MSYKDYPNQYQFVTFDKNHKLMHAGPGNAPRLSARSAIKYERAWLQWRREYIEANPGSYPLSNTVTEMPYIIVMQNIETDEILRVRYH